MNVCQACALVRVTPLTPRYSKLTRILLTRTQEPFLRQPSSKMLVNPGLCGDDPYATTPRSTFNDSIFQHQPQTLHAAYTHLTVR